MMGKRHSGEQTVAKPRDAEVMPSSANQQPRKQKRFLALDAFRGLAVAGMILVNEQGAFEYAPAQLSHAPWHGWTFADWIFPFFLFIVGAAIPLSINRYLDSGRSHQAIAWKIVRRTATIVAVALIMHGFPFYRLSLLLEPLVLKRIAFCYFVTSFVVFFLRPRGRIAVVCGLLGLYWALMMWYPVPGIGPGQYEPGRNFAAYLESLVVPGNGWEGSEIASLLTSSATCLLGTFAGMLFLPGNQKSGKTARLLGWGIGFILLGLFLSQYQPINKKLWTVSYTIFTAGLASMSLALFFWTIHERGLSRWATPLVILGSNALAIYVVSGVLQRGMRMMRIQRAGADAVDLKTYLFQSWYLHWMTPVWASVAFSLTVLSILYCIAWTLWKKGWFIRA